MSLEFYIPKNIIFPHSVFIKSDIPNNNLLTCAFESTTMCGAYLDIWVNFNL